MFCTYSLSSVMVFNGLEDEPRTIQVRERINEFVVSPKAEYFLCSTTMNENDVSYVDKYDFNTGEFLKRFVVDGYKTGSFCFLGSGLVVSYLEHHGLLVWNPDTNGNVKFFKETRVRHTTKTLLDGFSIVMALYGERGLGGDVRVWNTNTDESRTVSVNSIIDLDVSPVTGLVAIVDSEHTVSVYSPDVCTTVHVFDLRGFSEASSFTFSYDGLSVLCGNENGFIVLRTDDYTSEEFNHSSDMRYGVYELSDGRIIGLDADSTTITEVRPWIGLPGWILRRTLDTNASAIVVVRPR